MFYIIRDVALQDICCQPFGGYKIFAISAIEISPNNGLGVVAISEIVSRYTNQSFAFCYQDLLLQGLIQGYRFVILSGIVRVDSERMDLHIRIPASL